MKFATLFFLFFLVSCETDYRQTFPEVDQLFTHWDTDSTAGATVAIFKKGRLYYKHAYGMANLEYGIPNQTNSVFYAGSVSKQFVAMAMLLLEEEGKIDLNEDIRILFPEIPDYGAPINYYHLLHHSSGLRDYLDMWEIGGKHYIDYYDDDKVYDMITRQQVLNHVPGEKFMYCNSGYFLMQKAIEIKTGKTFAQYAREKILDPLGMTNSHFHDNYEHVIKNRAYGHRMHEDNTYGLLTMRFDLVGSGGLYTTVEDMEKWDANFYRNQLGKGDQHLIERMNEPGLNNEGKSLEYGLAQSIRYYRGYTGFFHNGVMGGYRSHFARLPGLETSVIILSNVEQFKPDFVALDIFDIIHKDVFVEQRITKKPSSEKEKGKEKDVSIQPDAAIGIYYSVELDASYRIRKNEPFLYLTWGNQPETRILIDTKNEFEFSDFYGRFNSDCSELNIFGWGMGPFKFVKVDP